ncbi:hypothetical protein GCM10009760_25720 [Kitasatospora kazusensis]|uniref:Uncharacterized protein n=1 Tax=Kitasatospora kazusensis TaxID=407974 RepID=A0ABN2ZFN7_9ACTN
MSFTSWIPQSAAAEQDARTVGYCNGVRIFCAPCAVEYMILFGVASPDTGEISMPGLLWEITEARGIDTSDDRIMHHYGYVTPILWEHADSETICDDCKKKICG